MNLSSFLRHFFIITSLFQKLYYLFIILKAKHILIYTLLGVPFVQVVKYISRLVLHLASQLSVKQFGFVSGVDTQLSKEECHSKMHARCAMQKINISKS